MLRIVGEAFRLPRDGKPVPYSVDRMVVEEIKIRCRHIVGANCVRPRAVTDRPYKFYRKRFAKFKFV